MDKRKLLPLSKILIYASVVACLSGGLAQLTRYTPKGIQLSLAAHASESTVDITTPELIQSLLNDDEDIRQQAFETLQNLEPSVAVSHLIEATSSPDWQVRTIAVHTLGRLGTKARGTILVVSKIAQRDKNSDVRFAATKALGEFGSASIEPVLIKALDDPDENIRLAAAQALTKLAPITGEAFPALVKASWDGNWMVRNQAIEALKQLNLDASEYKTLVDSLGNEFSDYDQRLPANIIAHTVLEAHGSRSVPTLVEQYKSVDDSPMRSMLSRLLGRAGSDEAVDFLLKALVDDSMYVPKVSVALGQISPDAALAELEAALEVDNQAKNIKKLSLIGSEKAVNYLKKHLDNSSVEVRDDIFEAIFQNLTEQSIPLFHEILRAQIIEGQETNYGRYTSSSTIVHSDPNKIIVPFYIERLIKGDIIDQKIAISLLENTYRRTYSSASPIESEEYEKLVSALVENLDHESGFISSGALSLLASFNDNQGLRDQYYSPDQLYYSPKQLPELDLPIENDHFISLLLNSFLSDEKIFSNDETDEIFSSNFSMGQWIGIVMSRLDADAQKQALLALIDNLHSPNERVILHSIQALSVILPRLDTDAQKQALPALIDNLHSSNKKLALNSIKALGSIESDNVLMHLMQAFESGDLEYRNTIVQTLENRNDIKTAQIFLLSLFNSRFSIEDEQAALRALNNIKPHITVIPNSLEIDTLKTKIMMNHFGNDSLNEDYRVLAGIVINQLAPEERENIISFLQKSLSSEDHETRHLAAQAIGAVEGAAETVIPPLVKQLQVSDELQRFEAISYLGEIGSQASVAVSHLKPFLNSEDWLFRYSAATALARIQAPTDCFSEILEESLQRDDERPNFYYRWNSEVLKENASESAIEELINYLRPYDQDYWYYSYHFSCFIPEPIFLLPKLGENAVPQLINSLKDPSVRFSVTQVLGDIGTDAVPMLLEVAKPRENFLVALREPLYGKNQDIRRSAIFALGQLENPSQKVIQTLKQILQDTNHHIEVRWMAAVALQHYGVSTHEFFVSENQPNPFSQSCPQGPQGHDLNLFDTYQKRCLYAESGCGDGFWSIYNHFRYLLTKRSSEN